MKACSFGVVKWCLNPSVIAGLDYEEFVYRAEDGTWRDRWLGLPLLRSAEELAALLDGGAR